MSQDPISKLDLNDLKNYYHIEKYPDYNLKKTFRYAIRNLTFNEFMIWSACKCYSLREAAKYFKKSHMYIKRVYERACRKMVANERRIEP